MAWFALLLAGLFEVGWSFAMKQSQGFTQIIPTFLTLILMLVSFGLLAFSMKTLPLGTAYTIWTGIGAIGAVVIGVMFLGEQLNAVRVMAVMLIVSGLVLMKLAAPE
ncbi:MAG TPA: multidrug efflux SMR transporter [Alphaproteobacteria bacterium]